MAYPDKDRYTPNKGTAGHSNWQEGDYVTAANMNHIEDGIDQAVQDAETYADAAVNTVKFIGGSSAPTTSTVGTVGQKYLYTNGTTKIIYECVDASNPYKWEILYRYDTAGEKWYRTDTDGDRIDVSSLIAEFEGDLAAVIKDIEDGTIEAGKAVAAKSIENVSEDSGSTQDEPFVIQGTGTANGTASVDTSPVAKQLEKRGNSAVVNQQIYNTTKNDTIDNSSGSSSIYGNWHFDFPSGNNVILNHEYIVMVYGSITVTGSGVALLYLNTGNNQGTFYNFKDGPGCTIKKITSIQAPTATAGLFAQIGPYTKVVFNGSVHMIDLTQWFNGNIPQDILDDPKRFFNYYGGSLAYNAGTLTNGTGQYLVNKHRNLWDEKWELGTINNDTGQNETNNFVIRSKNYIPVVPGGTYYFYNSFSVSGYSNPIFCYDANKTYLGRVSSPTSVNNTIFTIPGNCFFIRFRTGSEYGTTYSNNITISLYYSPDEGGADYDQYFPYEAPSVYETGTEVLRSAGSAKDIKTPDGTITRYIGTVDLSTLSWNYNATYSVWRATLDVKNKSLLIADKYIFNDVDPNELSAGQICARWSWWGSTPTIFVNNGSSTVEPTGNLNYELATPTTEQGTTFAENIEIDDYGTMEWLSTYDAENPNNNVYTAVPQACKIFYPADMVLFLDSLGQRTDIDWDAENIVSQEQLDEVGDKVDGVIEGTIPVNKAIVAEQIESVSEESGTTQEEPFITQGTGTDNGLNSIDTSPVAKQLEKRGNSAAVNQLAKVFNSANWATANGATVSYSEGVATLTPTEQYGRLQQYFTYVANHKMLIVANIKLSTATNGNSVSVSAYGIDTLIAGDIHCQATADWQTVISITTSTSASNDNRLIVTDARSSDWGTIQIKNYIAIDLTQWFNGDIPEDIIEDPKRFFRYCSDFTYNTGTLTNGTGRYLVNKHRNVWDEEWKMGNITSSDGQEQQTPTQYRLISKNYIRVIPGTKYYFYGGANGGATVYAYDGNKNYIKYFHDGSINTYITIPENAQYIKFQMYSEYGSSASSQYANNITISLYYSPDEGGADYDQYYPYEEPSVYDTGDEVLRSVNDIRDIKKPDGTITRNVGEYTFTGSESWTFNSTNNYFESFNISDPGKTSTDDNVSTDAGLIIRGFYYQSTNNGRLRIYLSDNSQLTSSSNMNSYFSNGKKVFYKLTTPTTEQGTSFPENISIDDYGTMVWLEEYDSAAPDNNVYTSIPQACAIFYPADMVLFMDTLGQRSDIGWDAENVVSQQQLKTETNDSLDNFSNELENKMGILIESNYDSSDKVWNFTVDPSKFMNALASLIKNDYGKSPTSFSATTQSAITQAGLAPCFYAVGDEKTVSKNGSNIVYQIIGFDQEDLSDDDAALYKHTITWQAKFAPGFRWDEPEMLFYFENGLAVGTYHFTSSYGTYGGGTAEDGTYQFTISTAIPAGGGLKHSTMGQWRSSYSKTNITGDRITTYGAPDSSGYRASIQSGVTVTEGSDGTDLGVVTFSSYSIHNNNNPTQNNYTGHNGYGNNNYFIYASNSWYNNTFSVTALGYGSDIDQYLNSDAASGSWWSAKTRWALRHTSYSAAGYLYGMDNDFANLLVTCKKKCGYPCTEASSTGIRIIERKVFLLSNTEVGFNVDGGDDGKTYPLYLKALYDQFGNYNLNNNACAGRVKKDSASGSATYWWLRSPYRGNSIYAWRVGTSGACNSSEVTYGYGCAPAFATR